MGSIAGSRYKPMGAEKPSVASRPYEAIGVEAKSIAGPWKGSPPNYFLPRSGHRLDWLAVTQGRRPFVFCAGRVVGDSASWTVLDIGKSAGCGPQIKTRSGGFYQNGRTSLPAAAVLDWT